MPAWLPFRNRDNWKQESLKFVRILGLRKNKFIADLYYILKVTWTIVL